MGKSLSSESAEEIKSAYRKMAEVGYRPMAPSDGFGNVTVPEDELNLEKEAEVFVEHWWKQEETGNFDVGKCCFETRRISIYAIAAAECLACFAPSFALKLLKLAVRELEGILKQQRQQIRSGTRMDAEAVLHGL